MNGILPTRASFMLDLVVIAMVLVVPLLAWSIHIVKKQRKYQLHKIIQLTLGAVLLVAVTAFEIDMRVNGWTQYAEASPHFDTLVYPILIIHLIIACSTAVLWIVVIVNAIRKFPSPIEPNAHSAGHKKLAGPAAWGMFLTAITGWIFYYIAFVA